MSLLFSHSPMPSSFPLPILFSFLLSHQPSAAVRGYHSSKPAAVGPSLGSNWVTASGGGQGAWSGTSFNRGSLQHYLSHHQHPHHHHQSAHTSYSYCSGHTPVSTADSFFLIVTLPLITCVLVSSCRILPYSLCYTYYF